MAQAYRSLALPLAAAILSVLLMSACSHDDKKDDAKVEEKKVEDDSKKLTPICPQVAIIRDLQTIKDYGREKASPDQLVAAARLNTVVGDCAYTDTGIDVKFELAMIAERGPGLGSGKISFPYFVAVVDPQQNILTKDTLTADFEFSGDKKLKEDSDKLHVFIPLNKAQRKTGPDYQVLIGFQYTQEQLDAARAK